jgi:Spx/MgsR family transcriptional regulator
MLTVYGIKQCDTCRKALKWLSDNDIDFLFHDFRVDGLDRARVDAWLNSSIAPALVNRRSTTWRGLSELDRDVAGDMLVNLLLANPTLIKRPVFEAPGLLAVGFDPATLEQALRTA